MTTTALIALSRVGLYGSINILWRSGFPDCHIFICYNISVTNTALITLSRVGLYGSINIPWRNGFSDSHIFICYNISVTNTALITLSRVGLYGSINIPWRSGFPDSQLPQGFVEGDMSPVSGSVSIAHGVETKNFTVLVSYWRWGGDKILIMIIDINIKQTLYCASTIIETDPTQL